MSTYKVQAGDTLSEIAAANNTTVDELAKANGISNVNLIRAGQELNIPGGTVQPKNTSGGASKVSTAKPTSTGKKLSGVSSGTQNQLDYYSSGYKQSDKVSAAEKYLEELRKNKPGEYQSQYEDQLSQLLDQIMNRGEFTYDLNSDVLYQQAKDQYVNLGRMAMMDTMGQAAALTGGYGNSYASTAGNQAYQAYLTQLNENIPEYYQLALDAYQRQGEDLYNRYGILNAADQTAYDRYRDTVSDYYTDLDYATNDYWNKYNADYGQYSDMLNYWQQQAQFENSDYWQQQDYLGLGPGAVSTLKDVRFAQPEDYSLWLEHMEQGAILPETEVLPPSTKTEELVMLSLRTARGLSLSSYSQACGRDFLEENRSLVQALLRDGLAVLVRQDTEGDGNTDKKSLRNSGSMHFTLTPEGMLVSNDIISRLFADMDAGK